MIRIVIFCISIFSVLSVISQEKTSGLLERSQIDSIYKWRTDDIYKSIDDWEIDFKKIEGDLPTYKKFEGLLNSSASLLLECLEFDEQIRRQFGYLRLYAKLNRDVDMNNNKFQQLWSRCATLETQIESSSAYIKPELIFLPDSTIKIFQTKEPKLTTYKHYFNIMKRKRDHTLSYEKEEELSHIAQLVNNPYKVFGSLVYADLPFPVIKDENGQDLQINRSTSWRLRSSTNRSIRKKGYNQYYISLGEFKETLTQNLSSFIQGKYFLSKKRNYNSSLEASLDRHNIPTEIYTNLLRSVKANIEPFHRWMSMKK